MNAHSSKRFHLRESEWLLLGFFIYLVLLIPFFQDRPHLGVRPLEWLAGVALVLGSLCIAGNGRYEAVIGMIRDWIPMALTLVAFREMELFLPLRYNTGYQTSWIHWDRLFFAHSGFTRGIESLGPLIPLYLELCYLLVYGVGIFCIATLWITHNRVSVNRFYVVMLTGTLAAYAMFPFFPSAPPRLAYPNVYPPHTHNIFRQVNLFLLGRASIHSGVFPSAHVSAAFSAAWAMFLVQPKRKLTNWLLLVYAISVTVATVYGRYHYLSDAVAGFGVSLIAAVLCLALRKRSLDNSL